MTLSRHRTPCCSSRQALHSLVHCTSDCHQGLPLAKGGVGSTNPNDLKLLGHHLLMQQQQGQQQQQGGTDSKQGTAAVSVDLDMHRWLVAHSNHARIKGMWCMG